MKMSKNWKRFWSLNRHNAEGFTLVELIVVIAILAILGGVAVPAYAGYVEKANRAGDEQLLSAVNRAYAAACVEAGVDILTLNSTTAVIEIAENGTIDTATIQPAAVAAPFAGFYAENEDAAFQVFDEIYFSAAKLGFAEDALVAFNLKGKNVNVPASAIEKLTNSTYGKEIGAQKLLGEVAMLTDWADSNGNAIVDSLGIEYVTKLGTYMGYDDVSEFVDYLGSDELTDDEYNSIMTNGIVLYAADNFSNLSNDRINELLNSGNIYSNLSDEKGPQLAEASLVYGLYTSYVNSDYYKGEPVSGASDPVAAVKTVSTDPEFMKYVNSAEGQADLDAYKSAMNVITNTTSNTEVITDVLKNGYDNTDLIGLMQEVMGK